MKKKRAESNLIKLRIIKKLHDNLELSEIERQYLNFWKQNELTGKSNQISNNPTKRSIKSLSRNDKTIFDNNFFYFNFEIKKDIL